MLSACIKREMINITMEDIEAGVGVSTDENKVKNNASLVKLAWNNSTLNKRKIRLWNIWQQRKLLWFFLIFILACQYVATKTSFANKLHGSFSFYSLLQYSETSVLTRLK